MEPLSVNTPPHNGGQGPVTPVRLISGRKLSRRRKGFSPSHRALLALDIETGKARVINHTRKQARALTGASVGYTNTAAKLTPDQRQKVERGQLSLAAFHNKHQPTDAALLQYIEKVGADRVMAALDRYTEPQFPLVAAE
jgi:hypothetical protein